MAQNGSLAVRVIDGVAAFLDEAASSSGVPEAVRAEARQFRSKDNISWDDLKSIADAYRQANPGKPVYLHKLCSWKDMVLPSPPPKEKSAELQARLARLQEELDNKRYNDMVADITVAERKADELRDSILPTSRLQLTYGAHVIVTMFTLWATCYYGSKYYLGYEEVWAGLAGALGLTAGLLVETLLLIIRSNRLVPLEERMPELFDKDKVREAFAKAKEIKQAERKSGKGGAAASGKGKQQQQQLPATSGAESKKAR